MSNSHSFKLQFDGRIRSNLNNLLHIRVQKEVEALTYTQYHSQRYLRFTYINPKY